MKGSIERRGERVYRIRVDTGRTADGRRVQKSVTVHGTRKEAEARMRKLVTEVERGGLAPAKALTVNQFLDYWLENHVSRLAKRTEENYRQNLEWYVRPHVGSVRLDRLTGAHVLALYATLEKEGGVGTRPNPKGGRGLAPQTVYNVHELLRGALKRAVKWQLLARSPMESVDLPRPPHREPNTLPDEDSAVLLRYVTAPENAAHCLPVLLALATGLRVGEVCGLRWRDVNFEASVLSVNQSLVHLKTGPLLKPPKTRSSRRVVALPSVLVEALRRERERQDALGLLPQADRLVVVNEKGRYLLPVTVYTRLQEALTRLGLKRVSFHDLRHTHATLLLGEKIHPKVVSERLGHAKTATTMDIYSHVLQNIQREAAETTDEVMRRALKEGKEG